MKREIDEAFEFALMKSFNSGACYPIGYNKPGGLIKSLPVHIRKSLVELTSKDINHPRIVKELLRGKS